MDDLWGLMNRLLSASDLIWDSDTKTEERHHHPALCLKYSSYLGKPGECGGEISEEVSEMLGDFIYDFLLKCKAYNKLLKLKLMF